ncbi:hypothetical protein [Streptomyces sp. AK08-02]|uniref:hypothetical protein n=1 Tax=Streptomyces sp. AK08-02 TaxID=3028654 RepID=UPI00299FAF13|nr:hypothetical protein [Streptomyces sp. AK08-02]MDX3746712.1 hypothetical protein [Streptomyces sp. AK08-02]
MSSVRGEYQVEGTFGHVQRVAAAGGHAAYTRSQAAYRTYISHGTECLDCGETARCTVSAELWQAYSEAKREADQG